MSAPNLTVDIVARGYRHGTTSYSDNSGNSLTVDYGCDTAVVRFTGQRLASY